MKQFLDISGLSDFFGLLKAYMADQFSSKKHTHSATDVGADPKGSSQQAITSANSYTDSKVGEIKTIEVNKTKPTTDNAEVWINPNEKDIITIPEVNDSLVNTVDTWSSKKISDILTKSTNDIAQMQNTVDALKTIEVRSTEPTATGTEMWVNPESQDVITIPEINDALTNKTDTWSSAKISEEVASASKSASADVSSIATMKASVEGTVSDFNTTATKANKTLTDTGTAQKNAVTDEGSKQVSAVKSAASEILKINGVEISDTTPTNTKTAVWINSKEKSSTTLPEVNDSAINTSDTWSSKKINDELQKLITRISALESK